jgi:NADH-quinone oxidoreductase subunit E
MAAAPIPKSELLSVFDAYPDDRRHALAVMQDMQRIYKYVPREGLELLAEQYGCPMSELYSMATFFKALSLEPKGRHVIKVCDGTACHIRGAVNLALGIGRVLNINPGETSEDGVFSLELVNCLGSCALAPVMVIGDTYYGKVTLESLPGIFEALREEAPK